MGEREKVGSEGAGGGEEADLGIIPRWNLLGIPEDAPLGAASVERIVPDLRERESGEHRRREHMRGEVAFVAGRETERGIAPIICEMQSNTQVANSWPSGAQRAPSLSLSLGKAPILSFISAASLTHPLPALSPASPLVPSLAKPYV